jgi:predicted RNA-binding protein associated with RNAse of E/G family
MESIPMSTSEVDDLIAALRSGNMTLTEVADRFRVRSWPRTRHAAARTPLEWAEQQDPAPDLPGSYDDLTGAYDRGQLTAEEYDVLCDAIADSIRAKAEQT